MRSWISVLTCSVCFFFVAGAVNAVVHLGTINGDGYQATACAILSDSQIRGTFSYDDMSGEFTWDYTFGDNAPAFDNGVLVNSGAEIFSHFHGPTLPDVMTDVRIPVPIGNPSSGSIVIGEAFGTELVNELWYLNVHSTECLNGELVGDLHLSANSVPSLSPVMGAGLASVLLVASIFMMRRKSSHEA